MWETPKKQKPMNNPLDAAIIALRRESVDDPENMEVYGAAIRVLEAAAKLTEPGMLSLHRVLAFCNIHGGCDYCGEMDKRLSAFLDALPDKGAESGK